MNNIDNTPWMIYGAYGYTGEIIAREAVKRGYRPILAGRNKTKLAALGRQLGLDYQAFDLAALETIKTKVSEVSLILHCAGPFSKTADLMLKACIESGKHYLDLSGEIDHFEKVFQMNVNAKLNGSTVIPGVGFDVVPTDCLAVQAAAKIDNPTHLELAFCGEGGASPGTAKTMIEMLPGKGRIRHNGKLKKVPVAYKRKQVAFSDRNEWCMTVPWGDVSTAYYSTGIPNIEMYTAVSRPVAAIARSFSPMMPVFGFDWLQQRMFAAVEKNVQGPDESVRSAGCMRIWARVSNAEGESAEMTMDVPEGYQFTVLTSLLCVEKILNENIAAGVHTPAQAFGADFINAIEGVRY